MRRQCPLCAGQAGSNVFPYSTQYNSKHYDYFKCNNCSTVFVDPLPDISTFSKMYAKDTYHSCYYKNIENNSYIESAQLLKRYLSKDSLVLDYGCGVGAFLKALKSVDLVPFGVELDRSAAEYASKNVRCKVLTTADFFALQSKPVFNAIHLGDVLAHLSDPAGLLNQLLYYLSPRGILFLEGPLETNPSPVYYASKFTSGFKKLVKLSRVSDYPPFMLYRTSAKQQLAFFQYLDTELILKEWKVYDTGWPYTNGGIIKRTISKVAVAFGGRSIFGLTFGNRFKGIFVKSLRNQFD